ncbi:hypothetical protein [Rhizobium sp. BK176]|uniref:hypothetical protein n=1 Tax=Rhizobium sp. BK176 TaxID=2587071 RepID=UPI002167A02A|nr:hypothetical protein [Rhizobium sp. BK176]MCS4089228.1 hypothetical protein [Rhizobium sp. BK176]
MSNSDNDPANSPSHGHKNPDRTDSLPTSTRSVRKSKYTIEELIEGHVPGPISEELRAWEVSPAVGNEVW